MPISRDPEAAARQKAQLVNAPPAPLGNTRSLKHGAFSSRLIDEWAPDLAVAVFEANPHLDAQRDAPAVHRYVNVWARHLRVSAWLDEQADPLFADVGEGRVHPVVNRVERWEKQLDGMERQLALAPLTRAQLGLTLAHGQSLIERMADDHAREIADE